MKFEIKVVDTDYRVPVDDYEMDFESEAEVERYCKTMGVGGGFYYLYKRACDADVSTGGVK
jgi:hypothetical protein